MYDFLDDDDVCFNLLYINMYPTVIESLSSQFDILIVDDKNAKINGEVEQSSCSLQTNGEVVVHAANAEHGLFDRGKCLEKTLQTNRGETNPSSPTLRGVHIINYSYTKSSFTFHNHHDDALSSGSFPRFVANGRYDTGIFRYHYSKFRIGSHPSIACHSSHWKRPQRRHSHERASQHGRPITKLSNESR